MIPKCFVLSALYPNHTEILEVKYYNISPHCPLYFQFGISPILRQCINYFFGICCANLNMHILQMGWFQILSPFLLSPLRAFSSHLHHPHTQIAHLANGNVYNKSSLKSFLMGKVMVDVLHQYTQNIGAIHLLYRILLPSVLFLFHFGVKDRCFGPKYVEIECQNWYITTLHIATTEWISSHIERACVCQIVECHSEIFSMFRIVGLWYYKFHHSSTIRYKQFPHSICQEKIYHFHLLFSVTTPQDDLE